MFKVLLPNAIADQLSDALQQGGGREIGGILMGEHVESGVFRIRAITIQRYGGTFATFERFTRPFITPLRRFFNRTGHNYTRFNYLGEWHSHPGFAPEPSQLDCHAMWEMVDDSLVGANFAVLLIVRLLPDSELNGTATLFLPGGLRFEAQLLHEIEAYDR